MRCLILNAQAVHPVWTPQTSNLPRQGLSRRRHLLNLAANSSCPNTPRCSLSSNNKSKKITQFWLTWKATAPKRQLIQVSHSLLLSIRLPTCPNNRSWHLRRPRRVLSRTLNSWPRPLLSNQRFKSKIQALHPTFLNPSDSSLWYPKRTFWVKKTLKMTFWTLVSNLSTLAMHRQLWRLPDTNRAECTTFCHQTRQVWSVNGKQPSQEEWAC